jgi:hypothetical protein
MTLKAKTVLKNKFWIVEEEGQRVGTISVSDDRFMLSANGNVTFYENKRQIEKQLGKTIFDREPNTKIEVVKEVYGYPTSTSPYNVMYDVKRKLPLFTKSSKSKSLYSAGYYIIRFDKGWVKSFCPKLITLDRYTFEGPFKNDLEMRQELSNANKRAS